MAAEVFSSAHGDAVKALKSEDFAGDGGWPAVIKGARKVLTTEGFDSGSASSLDDLRKLVEKGRHAKKAVADTLLLGAGQKSVPGGHNIIPPALAQRVAALALLQNVHLIRKFGSHKFWIVSLPDSYKGWPQDDLVGSYDSFKAKLEDSTSRFSLGDRKHLSNATQEAIKWVHKTMIVAGDPKKTKHKELLSRWFGHDGVTDAMLTAAASTLNDGFKKIAKVLKSGHLIMTDNPCDRGKADLEESEAYVWYDTLDVVYVEKAFFRTDQMLVGLPHWTRILVHELTHREAKTIDVPGRYAWGGIKPTKDAFPHAKAITNADSWAWFCADCAGALTQANRDAALK